MKKSIISVFAVIIMALALIQCAFADMTLNLGSFSAGAEINMPMFDYTGDYTFDRSQLPVGCNLSEVNGKVCLTGAPVYAGTFCYDVTTADSIYTCYVDIMPDMPTSVVCGDKQCKPNENVVINVNAHIRDGGSLSYQWYSNTDRSVVGGYAIPGASSSAYTVNTSVPGTSYYYCNITNSNSGMSINAYSEVIAVSVAAPGVSYIRTIQLPDKTEYKLNDYVDVTGLVLEVGFMDGTKKNMTEGYTVSPKRITEDTNMLRISYEGAETTIPITVEKKISIVISKMPTKQEYHVGDVLDTEGLELEIFSGSGQGEKIKTGFTCEPLTFNTVGTQVITVKYKDATANFSVKVSEKDKDTLNVITMPTKTEYKLGEKLNTSGLVLELKSGDKTNAVTSGFTCSPEEFTSTGIQPVTVKYKDLSCTFNVNVKEADAALDTADDEPAAPQTTPAHGSTIKVDTHHSLMVIIVILAVLMLITLGVYIYVSRIKNTDESAVGSFLRRFRDRDE